MDENIHIVIPARLRSTRLPEKLLLRETGKSVLQHTYEAAQRATLSHGITVAVDDPRLLEEVQRFQGHARMTDPNAASGTDRIAEIARVESDVDIFVNVQGDEPEISGQAIDAVIRLMTENPSASMATLATPLRTKQDLEDPSCVKVVLGHQGQALYFSRSVIPHPREWCDSMLQANPPHFLQHLGLYAYRRKFLLKLAEFPYSPLENLEKLEQLRFLQAGCVILVGTIEHRTRGIDTENDYRAFVRRQTTC